MRMLRCLGQNKRWRVRLLDFMKSCTIRKTVLCWEGIIEGVPTTTISSMNAKLIKPIEEDEVKSNICYMIPMKASGHDDIVPYLFSLFRDSAKIDVFSSIQSFCTSSIMLKQFNHTKTFIFLGCQF